MQDGSEERRLAAILVTDVVGFSRMMASDEKGTLERLNDLRLNLIEPLIVEYSGRVVKLMGDGILVEFSSVTAAVECAAKIQQQISEKNKNTPTNPKIQLRIGINLGEVIVEENDIFGDGVNIAARLESVAEAGSVAVSGSVFDQAKGKVSLGFKFLGERQLKNIPTPVRVYQVSDVQANTTRQITFNNLSIKRRPVMISLGALALGAGGISTWWLSSTARNERESSKDPNPGSISEKPSIVVLPFDNLSGSPEQSYFSDGMTESIITDLSRVSGLLVIARNTSFTFKNQAIDIQSIATELGVRYVVEGSIQRASGRVRINAKLIDAASGHNLWAEKLDNNASDLFALQDEVTGRIINALKIELTQKERQAVAKIYTDNLEAYELFLQAWEFYWQFNNEGRRRARELLNEALVMDNNFARAQGLLAATYTSQVGSSLQHSRESLDKAYELALGAVELDPDLPQVHWVLGLVNMFLRKYEAAENSVNRAIKLDPNFADAYALLCWTLQYAGEPERGLAAMDIAMRLNPRPPFPYLNAKAESYFSLGQYDRSIEVSNEALERNPAGQRLRMIMAASLALQGKTGDAQWEIEELLIHEPDFTISAVQDIAPYKDPVIFKQLIEGLRLAGLPD